MLGFYNYTVYLTYISLLSSVIGMFIAIGGQSSGNLQISAICLLISGVCDMFDGKVARTKKDRTDEEKRFGIQIDSLCDVVCFGVFPTVMLFSIPEDLKIWHAAFASFFVLCGVIRLGYFNVTEETRQKVSSENRSAYSGLPITASAVVIPLLVCFQEMLGSSFSSLYACLLALLGICYITPFSIKKPGKAGCIVLIIAGLLILFAILH